MWPFVSKVSLAGAGVLRGWTDWHSHILPGVDDGVRSLADSLEVLKWYEAQGVSEVWLTFSDPQLSGSGNSRLSAPVFLERYRSFLRPGGIVHLKTDSRFLHEYTMSVIRANGLEVLKSSTDIYKEGDMGVVTQVQTFYEKMFLQLGLPITYVAFRIDHEGPFVQPADFDAAYWRELEGPRRSFSHQPSPKA